MIQLHKYHHDEGMISIMDYRIIEEKEVLHEMFVDLMAKLNRINYRKSIVTMEIHRKAKSILDNLLSDKINSPEHITEIKNEYFSLKKALTK